jgi:methionine aminopeptidase
MAKCVDGANVHELCSFGKDLAFAEMKLIYNKKKSIEKGFAFPLCISVNEICGHYSPL